MRSFYKSGEIRYRDRCTGQLHCSDTPQHVIALTACARCIILQEVAFWFQFAVRFPVEHVNRLIYLLTIFRQRGQVQHTLV